MKQNKHNLKNGFSLVEIVLAMAIFMILAVVGITTVLQSFSVNKLSSEQLFADLYAQEGIEAVRSIKNRGWSSLAVGTYGLSSSTGVWAFSGSSDSRDKYTRQLNISEVQRDINGDIVESGGTVDVDTLKVDSVVTWNFSGPRNDTVSHTTFLTNFKKTKEGIILYSGLSYPKWRNYSNTSDSFDRDKNLPDAITGVNLIVRSSPVNGEVMAGVATNTGGLNVYCYESGQWNLEWTQNIGGNGSTRRFDISYETNSGDAVVLYNNNNSSQIGYRTKSGSAGCGSSSWSGHSTYTPLRTNGIIHWIKTSWDRRSSSNLVAVSWADANQDLSSAVWSGTAFGNEPSNTSETSLEIISTGQDIDCFDIEYESLSGDIMLIWANSSGSNGTNGVRYRICTGGTSSCAWEAITTPPTFADDAHNLDISANPASDEIVFASIGYAGCDLQVGYWSGSGWTNRANLDTASLRPGIGSSLVTTGWLTSGTITRSIIVYHDATNNSCRTDNGTRTVDWYIGNTATFTRQSDFSPTPLFSNPQNRYEIYIDPKNSDSLLLVISDSAYDIFAKRLHMTSAPEFTWSNSDGGSALDTDLGQNITNPFGFAYFRNP